LYTLSFKEEEEDFFFFFFLFKKRKTLSRFCTNKLRSQKARKRGGGEKCEEIER